MIRLPELKLAPPGKSASGLLCPIGFTFRNDDLEPEDQVERIAMLQDSNRRRIEAGVF
jgi:hypothetical protein